MPCPFSINLSSRQEVSPPLNRAAVDSSTPLTLRKKVSSFIIENWRILTAYVIAWVLIITLMGAMHGFTKVSQPIAIGLSGGIVLGALSAAVVVGYQSNRYHPKSGWQLFRNNILSPLDPIVSTIAVSIIATMAILLMIRLPHGVSAIIGCVMGNHLFTQILLKGRKPPEEALAEPSPRINDNAELLRRIAALEARLLPEAAF